MNSLGSWIDPKLMAGAAEELAGRGSLADEFAQLLAGPGNLTQQALKLEDFSPTPLPPESEQRRVRNMLEDVKRRASESGLLRGISLAAPSQPPPAPVPASADQESILSRRGLPFFVPPFGPLATRIRALVDWLKRQVQADSIFIIDAQGCPMTDTEPAPNLLAGALLLSDAARRTARHVPATGSGALQVDCADGKKLCVIHTETKYGHFCLGLVGADTLSPSTADRLRRALQRTVEADGETGHGQIERM